MDIPLIAASDDCRRADHRLAEGQLLVGETVRQLEAPVCLTCTEAQGYLRGLKAWQESCPCCFSKTMPEGLPTLRPVTES